MTSVSIAMATYNGARFLKEQLDSLARQTHLPSELVVTDDASTDGTLDIITAFAATAPFSVRIEKNSERLGYRKNFMKAVSLCKYELIAFCDQDDVWMPRKLELCLAPFANPNVLLSYHAALAVDERLQPLGATTLQAAPHKVNPPQSLSPWLYGLGFTLSMRQSLTKFAPLWPQSADFFKPQFPEAHDQWFFFLASSLGTIAYSSGPLVLYRQHSSNTEGWKAEANPFVKIQRLLAIDNTTLLQARATAAMKRGLIMDQIASTNDAFNAEAQKAAKEYNQLAELYQKRLDFYKRPRLLDRLQDLRALYAGGSYSSPYLSRKELLRDIIRGVFFP